MITQERRIRTITRKYGLPFEGFTSSVPAHLCPINKVWSASLSIDSQNYIFDPVEGKFLRRLGIANVGGTSGILATAISFPRAITALHSPSIVDLGNGYPTHAVLWSEGTGAADDDASLYVRSTIGAGNNYELGEEFSANHYPGAAAATANIKCPPYFRTTDGTFGRLNSTAKRTAALAGSRGMLEAGGHLCFPAIHAMPMRWNKRYNDSSASGSENLRLYPMGRIPPLGRLSVATGTANATGTWRSGDKFYLSVVYKYKDGTWSAPMIPRNINDQLTSGYGLFTLGASCDYITVSGIPIGEDDVEARAILRTPKKAGDGTNPSEPDPLDLRLAAYLPNNTETSRILNDGNDLGLAIRTDIVPPAELGGPASRQWPSPARHIWPACNRIFMGYTNPHPGAIILAPDVNVADDSATILSTVYEYGLAAGVLTLYKGANTTTITADSTRTVQQVVDAINATTDSGANGGKWHAALVPGADGSVACGTGAGANQNLASTTGIDVGDTASRVRCFASSYPGIIYYSTTYLADPSRKGPFKTRWRFSEGGPHLGVSTFVDMWPAANIRTGSDSWGHLMGGAPLAENSSLLFFSKAIVLFRNKTGNLDQDYHAELLFSNIGCLGTHSIAWGDGWAGCLTRRGYLVFDGSREGMINISRDIHNPVSGDGHLSYEIAQGIAGIGKDDDSCQCFASVLNGQLNLVVRTAASTFRRFVYDFSPTVAQSGSAQVLRDGKPYGWSTPLRYSGVEPTYLCQVEQAAGAVIYGPTAFTHPNGRVEQYDTGHTDNGSTIGCVLVFALDMADTMQPKMAQDVRFFYLFPDTGATFAFNLNDGESGYQTADLALPQTIPGATFKRLPMPLPSDARAPCIANRIVMGTFNSTTQMKVWGAELDEIVTESYE